MADYDALASAFDATLSGTMRSVVSSLLRTSADVWRNPAADNGRRAAPELYQSGILLRLATPSASSLQLLQDLGAEKADRVARAMWDADIKEGDELHVGETVYQVERVAKAADKTLLAVWEVKS